MAWLPYPDPPLADGIVLLRPWVESDLPCIAAGKGVGEDAARDWLGAARRRQAGGAGLSLAIADATSGEALGSVGLLFRPAPGTAPIAGPEGTGLLFEPEPAIVGVGYWVLERARRRGLASCAVSLLAEWALGTASLRRVEALVEPDNVASRRVLERAGFEQEGRLRSYLAVPDGRRDALIYARVSERPADS